jgi:hypothetical protein
MWLFNKKRADLVAQSISQLIHLLSAGREDHGPTGPEKLLPSTPALCRLQDDAKRRRASRFSMKMAG